MSKELTSLKYCNETLELKTATEGLSLKLGERLLKIRDEELYKPQWDSFAEYVWEMHWSEAYASKLISIYSKFILEYGIPEQKLLDAGGWSVAYEVLPMVKNKQDAEEWLEKVHTVPRGEIRKMKREAKTGISEMTCPHPEGESYLLKICTRCGLKARVYESTGESEQAQGKEEQDTQMH